MPLSTTAARAVTGPGIGQADLAGSYVYKFEGNAMRNNVLHRICGIGRFTLDAAGRLTGSHTSSGMPLQGSVRNGVLVATFRLEGTLLLDEGAPLGDADIVFASDDPNLDSVRGRFRFAVAGTPDRLWLMSTGATILGKGDPINIAELVLIEVARTASA